MVTAVTENVLVYMSQLNSPHFDWVEHSFYEGKIKGSNPSAVKINCDGALIPSVKPVFLWSDYTGPKFNKRVVQYPYIQPYIQRGR